MQAPSQAKQLKSMTDGVVTGPAVWAVARARTAMWDAIAKSPARVRAAQTEILLSHCATAAQTEFGRDHRLGRVRSPEEFRSRVPLRAYADFEPLLVRMRKGARDVLWPGLVPYYGCSSGTSHTAAQNKYLPISLQQIEWQRKSGFDVVARYLTMSGDKQFTRTYGLALLPPGSLKREGPVEVASNPGIMQSRMPKIALRNTLPQSPVRDIENYDLKLTRIAESYLDYNVGSMMGTTCWFSILFDRVLAAARKKGRHVETISDIWPNLRVLFGGGVNAEPYRAVIDERVGRPTVLMDNYNATEGGIFACTDRLGDDSLLMIPDRGVYYEFVPREDHGKPNPRRLSLWEVEPEHDYSVVLTTSSGLFGYTIGDFVRFTSVFPHRIKFAGRASGVLSLTQELMTQIEIENAVTAASSESGCTIVDFAAAADVGVGGTAKGRYVFFVEFEREPADLAAFARAVEHGLCKQNRVYREHRSNDVAIFAPVIVPLEKGTTRAFMGALGQSSVQQKFPRILDDRRRDLMRSLVRTDRFVDGK